MIRVSAVSLYVRVRGFLRDGPSSLVDGVGADEVLAVRLGRPPADFVSCVVGVTEVDGVAAGEVAAAGVAKQIN